MSYWQIDEGTLYSILGVEPGGLEYFDEDAMPRGLPTDEGSRSTFLAALEDQLGNVESAVERVLDASRYVAKQLIDSFIVEHGMDPDDAKYSGHWYKNMADDFAQEELFGLRGGDPEYNEILYTYLPEMFEWLGIPEDPDFFDSVSSAITDKANGVWEKWVAPTILEAWEAAKTAVLEPEDEDPVYEDEGDEEDLEDPRQQKFPLVGARVKKAFKEYEDRSDYYYQQLWRVTLKSDVLPHPSDMQGTIGGNLGDFIGEHPVEVDEEDGSMEFIGYLGSHRDWTNEEIPEIVEEIIYEAAEALGARGNIEVEAVPYSSYNSSKQMSIPTNPSKDDWAVRTKRASFRKIAASTQTPEALVRKIQALIDAAQAEWDEVMGRPDPTAYADVEIYTGAQAKRMVDSNAPVVLTYDGAGFDVLSYQGEMEAMGGSKLRDDIRNAAAEMGYMTEDIASWAMGFYPDETAKVFHRERTTPDWLRRELEDEFGPF